MGQWRYALHDLLTGAQLAEHVPLEIDSYSTMLGEAGSLSADLPLGDLAIRALQPRGLFTPRKTNLVLYREGVPVWDGIIWTVRRKRGGRENSVTIGATEIRSYFTHRVFRPELGYGSTKTLSFTQADLFTVFRAILGDAQTFVYNGMTPGDLRIDVDVGQLSGILIDRRDVGDQLDAYHGYNFASHAQLLDDLAATDPGMEWKLEPYLDEGTLRRRLILGSPTVGTAGNDPGLATLEYPGDILSYEWPDDGEASANYVAVLGSGEADHMFWAEAYNTAELAAGYPLLEATASHKDAASTVLLGEKATADLAARTGDRTVPSLELKGFAPFSVGDHVRVRISDEDWWPGSGTVPYEGIVRVVGKTIVPGGSEKTTLTIEEPRSAG